MPRYLPEPARHTNDLPQTAVLLVNLGSPAAPTPKAVRAYLKEFLSDPRVIELPDWLWQPILHTVILTTRPKVSAEKYASVWTREGAPLVVHTAEQARFLKGYLGEAGIKNVPVRWAMRYGSPGVGEVLSHLKAEGVTRILVAPLYPQYAASTTASVMDALGTWLARIRNQPEIRVLRDFHSDLGYIAALAAQIRRHRSPPFTGTKLVLSFHGLPEKSRALGDPYYDQCQETAALLAQALDLKPDTYCVTFQSRFGREDWLQPYTQETLEHLPGQGVRAVDVFCPGFVADCLETLEEIALFNREKFLAAGGSQFRYIPALNEAPEWLAALAALTEKNLRQAGWIAGESTCSLPPKPLNPK
ncbi:MAG: ferrochelatase [Zoogloeaceae bacterium]|jgi:ferrochelatase|nr:ferrochelatase [Zoogloeaceae bacterium]